MAADRFKRYLQTSREFWLFSSALIADRVQGFIAEHFRTKRSRRAAGGTASVLIHLLILAMLYWTGASKLWGLTPSGSRGGDPAATRGDSTGSITVTLVAIRSAGDEQTKTKPVQAEAGDDAGLDAHMVDALSTMTASPKQNPGKGDNQQHTAPDAAPEQSANAATSAAANGLPNQRIDGQGGDPDGTQNILRQIARCLPPGSLPNVTFAHLNLAFDETGALRLAPSYDAPPPQGGSDADIQAANLVVQAALQCGPYQLTGGTPLTLTVAPDFRFLQTPPDAQAHE